MDFAGASMDSEMMANQARESEILWGQWRHLEEELFTLTKGPCDAQWDSHCLAFKCLDCEIDPTCAVCADCFFGADHTGHDYQLITTSGGCCDCGDISSWDPAGCCDRHCDITEEEDERNLSRLPLDFVMHVRRVVGHLIQAADASIGSSSGTAVRQVAERLHAIASTNRPFCYVVSTAFTAEIIHRWCRAHGQEDDQVQKALYNLYMLLFSCTSFKRRFARYGLLSAYLSAEPADMDLGLRRSAIGRLSVQVFTVESIAREFAETDLVFSVLADRVSRGMEANYIDGVRHVNLPKKQHRLWFAVSVLDPLVDLGFFMHHETCCSFLVDTASEPASQLASLLDLLLHLHRMNRQVRFKDAHIDYDNITWLSTFQIERCLIQAFGSFTWFVKRESLDRTLPVFQLFVNRIKALPQTDCDLRSFHTPLTRVFINCVNFDRLRGIVEWKRGGPPPENCSHEAAEGFLRLFTTADSSLSDYHCHPTALTVLLREAVETLHFADQVENRFWIRNGQGINQQLSEYSGGVNDRDHRSQLDMSCNDLEVVQFCALLLPFVTPEDCGCGHFPTLLYDNVFASSRSYSLRACAQLYRRQAPDSLDDAMLTLLANLADDCRAQMASVFSGGTKEVFDAFRLFSYLRLLVRTLADTRHVEFSCTAWTKKEDYLWSESQAVDLRRRQVELLKRLAVLQYAASSTCTYTSMVESFPLVLRSKADLVKTLMYDLFIMRSQEANSATTLKLRDTHWRLFDSTSCEGAAGHDDSIFRQPHLTFCGLREDVWQKALLAVFPTRFLSRLCTRFITTMLEPPKGRSVHAEMTGGSTHKTDLERLVGRMNETGFDDASHEESVFILLMRLLVLLLEHKPARTSEWLLNDASVLPVLTKLGQTMRTDPGLMGPIASRMWNTFEKRLQEDMRDCSDALPTLAALEFSSPLPVRRAASSRARDLQRKMLRRMRKKQATLVPESELEEDAHELQCVLCRGGPDPNSPFGYVAHVAHTSSLRRLATAGKTSMPFKLPCMNTCGHLTHVKCLALHMREQRRRDAGGNAYFVISGVNEFNCPACRALSNTVVPYIPRSCFVADDDACVWNSRRGGPDLEVFACGSIHNANSEAWAPNPGLSQLIRRMQLQLRSADSIVRDDDDPSSEGSSLLEEDVVRSIFGLYFLDLEMAPAVRYEGLLDMLRELLTDEFLQTLSVPDIRRLLSQLKRTLERYLLRDVDMRSPIEQAQLPEWYAPCLSRLLTAMRSRRTVDASATSQGDLLVAPDDWVRRAWLDVGAVLWLEIRNHEFPMAAARTLVNFGPDPLWAEAVQHEDESSAQESVEVEFAEEYLTMEDVMNVVAELHEANAVRLESDSDEEFETAGSESAVPIDDSDVGAVTDDEDVFESGSHTPVKRYYMRKTEEGSAVLRTYKAYNCDIACVYGNQLQIDQELCCDPRPTLPSVASPAVKSQIAKTLACVRYRVTVLEEFCAGKDSDYFPLIDLRAKERRPRTLPWFLSEEAEQWLQHLVGGSHFLTEWGDHAVFRTTPRLTWMVYQFLLQLQRYEPMTLQDEHTPDALYVQLIRALMLMRRNPQTSVDPLDPDFWMNRLTTNYSSFRDVPWCSDLKLDFLCLFTDCRLLNCAAVVDSLRRFLLLRVFQLAEESVVQAVGQVNAATPEAEVSMGGAFVSRSRLLPVFEEFVALFLTSDVDSGLLPAAKTDLSFLTSISVKTGDPASEREVCHTALTWLLDPDFWEVAAAHVDTAKLHKAQRARFPPASQLVAAVLYGLCGEFHFAEFSEFIIDYLSGPIASMFTEIGFDQMNPTDRIRVLLRNCYCSKARVRGFYALLLDVLPSRPHLATMVDPTRFRWSLGLIPALTRALGPNVTARMTSQNLLEVESIAERLLRARVPAGAGSFLDFALFALTAVWTIRSTERNALLHSGDKHSHLLDFFGVDMEFSQAELEAASALLFRPEVVQAVARCQQKGLDLEAPSFDVETLVVSCPMPYAYFDIVRDMSRRRCVVCKTMPKEPALCLLCGALLCIRTCCALDSLDLFATRDEGECTRHARACGGGQGVFLLCNLGRVLLCDAPRCGLYPAPWVDEYGETDPELKRGKPLFLTQTKADTLLRHFVSGSIGREIVRRNEMANVSITRAL